ncbi:MAG TPA: hypothetical protein VH684_15580 [Xanthobacteraceae bacterium]
MHSVFQLYVGPSLDRFLNLDLGPFDHPVLVWNLYLAARHDDTSMLNVLTRR